MARKATVGLFSLYCACGQKARVLDVLQRSITGRETVRHYCHECGTISWWWRDPGRPERVMLFDREERPADADRWPPPSWMHRHCPPRRIR